MSDFFTTLDLFLLLGNTLGSSLDDGIGDCFLHEVDFTLADKLHVNALERDQTFLILAIHHSFKSYVASCITVLT